MMNKSNQPIASRLLRAVIAKSFVEIFVVCVIATLAAFSNFSPMLRGHIDVADQMRVSGWVYDPLAPNSVIQVQLFIDGHFVAARVADESREDLVEAGATNKPNHGFTFSLKSLNLTRGKHTVQVYALRGTSGATKALIPISRTPRVFQVVLLPNTKTQDLNQDLER
jgi:hypothetical protein